MGFSMGQTVFHTQVVQTKPGTNEEVKEPDTSDENIKTKRIILRERQKEYLKYITDSCPLISSLELVGCGKCDPRIKKLCNPAHTINDGLLEKQVVFKHIRDNSENGMF